jgi:hypothetical protein
VVHDDGDVLVMATHGQLINADVHEAIKAVLGTVPVHDPPGDVAHRGPGDAHQLAHGGLVGALGQVADLVLEGVGEPGAGRCPRHLLDADAAVPAAHAAQVAAQVEHHAGDVQVAPAPAAVPVVAGPHPSAALGTSWNTPAWSDVQDESVGAEVGVADDGVLQLEHLSE